tara:strand:+ start:1230 stop:2687 length:1458 start_codon:yes stop_codon:yes gene_type:complete
MLLIKLKPTNMKNLTLFGAMLIVLSLNAQTTKIEKNDNVYLTISKDDVSFFKNFNNEDDPEALMKEHTLNVKKNTLNMFLDWINPLQYKLVLQDSVINDVRIEEVKKFFTENISGLAGGSQFVPGSSNKVDNGSCFASISNNINDIIDNDSGFSPTAKTEKEKIALTLLKELKENIKATILNFSVDYEQCIKTSITTLFNADTKKDAILVVNDAEALIKKVEANENKTIANLYILENLITKMVAAEVGQSKTALITFQNTQSSSFKNTKKLLELLKLYVIQVKVSLKKESKHVEDYFQLKRITIPKSKSVQLAISFNQRELKNDYSISEKGDKKSYTILIQRYDFITPKVGSGLFYSSATLKAFGVSANDQDQLAITENNVDKNTAVTGVFLNLNFDIGSQFLQPLLQIGVDPTKERPYLLVGGGFSIPVSNFSISGGPIWTWEAQLKKLNLGDTVQSTSVLEDDIEYKFQTAPRGFYLGLNYSF